jgi:hypothetical protein
MVRSNWSASSTTVPIPAARVTPRRKARNLKSPSRCPSGRSDGTCFVGSAIVALHVKDIEEVAATLEPGERACAQRKGAFEGLIDRFSRTEDPIHRQMVQVMTSFLAGLFVGEGKFELIRDNLDLERWFRLPKSHERRIHGHRHAGIRIVLEGPTLMHALDAHAAHPEPFTVDDLLPYRASREPPCQTQALNRRTIMRKARSPKKRPLLLADLERRYREAPKS